MFYRSLSCFIARYGCCGNNVGKFQIASYSNRKTHHNLLAHTIFDPPNPADGDLDCPVLITHCLLGSKEDWAPVGKAIARAINKKVITFDARNHGDSPHTKTFSYKHMADDVLNLVQHLRIDQFIFMGHSMGGRTAMVFALKYPKMVERLVVVDVSPLELCATYAFMKIYIHALSQLEKKYLSTAKSLSVVRKLAEAALKAVVNDPSFREFLLSNLISKDGKIVFKVNLPVLLDKFHEIDRFPTELLEKTFEEPTLFIRGEQSMYIPQANFSPIQKTFVHARFATIKNAGHWPHLENADQFMSTLLPFLKGYVE